MENQISKRFVIEEKLGKQSFHFRVKKVFEPVTKGTTEAAKKTTEAVEATVKAIELKGEETTKAKYESEKTNKSIEYIIKTSAVLIVV